MKKVIALVLSLVFSLSLAFAYADGTAQDLSNYGSSTVTTGTTAQDISDYTDIYGNESFEIQLAGNGRIPALLHPGDAVEQLAPASSNRNVIAGLGLARYDGEILRAHGLVPNESGYCTIEGWLQVQNDEKLFSVVSEANIQVIVNELAITKDGYSGYRAVGYEPGSENLVARIWVGDLFFDVFILDENDEWCYDGKLHLALNAGQKPQKRQPVGGGSSGTDGTGGNGNNNNNSATPNPQHPPVVLPPSSSGNSGNSGSSGNGGNTAAPNPQHPAVTLPGR